MGEYGNGNKVSDNSCDLDLRIFFWEETDVGEGKSNNSLNSQPYLFVKEVTGLIRLPGIRPVGCDSATTSYGLELKQVYMPAYEQHGNEHI